MACWAYVKTKFQFSKRVYNRLVVIKIVGKPMSQHKQKNQRRNPPPKVKKISEVQADEFLARVARACQVNDSAMIEGDTEIARALIEFNAWVVQQLEQGDLTIKKLRKLFQIQGSEKASHRCSNNNNDDDHHNASSDDDQTSTDTEVDNGPSTDDDPPSTDDTAQSNKQQKGHGRNGFADYEGAPIIHVNHAELSRGDTCPGEGCYGRLYEMSEPGLVVRVSGAPLANAKRYQLQKLRCAVCETIYTADLPQGVSDKKYDEGFKSMLMIHKYFISVPLYRQQRLQKYLGIPLPASTQWDLMVAHKPMLKALYNALYRDAAQGLTLCYDDTHVKVLNEIKRKQAAPKGEKKQHNCFTTGVVSLHEDHRTHLFMTDNRVAGQFIGDLLKYREAGQELPTVMCDALSANIPQGISDGVYQLCYCLVHARRQFYELPDGYDDLVNQVIYLIGKLYEYDSHTKDTTAEDRLAYHQKHSQPVMDKLKAYLQEQQKQFEPNGVAGQAINYMLKRWTQLSGFLKHAYAPLDNNIVERALKLVIQTRKSSLFYKTLNSAAFASYVQSALYSAAENDINPCDYMQALLENEASVKANPQAWLPWHYQDTLKQIQQDAATMG